MIPFFVQSESTAMTSPTSSSPTFRSCAGKPDRLLPLPQREDAFLHRQPDQAVLPLLRLRGPRHGPGFSHGIQRPELRRSGQGPGPARRSAGARGRAPAAPRHGGAGRIERGSGRTAAARHRLLPGRAEEIRARHRVSQGPWPHRRDRRPLRARLRASRLAALVGGFPRLRCARAGRGRPGGPGGGQQAL
jgi:hypothetical protein